MEVQRKRQETYCNTFAMVIIYKKNDDSCDKRATAVKISKYQNLALDSVYLGYHFLAVGKARLTSDNHLVAIAYASIDLIVLAYMLTEFHLII